MIPGTESVLTDTAVLSMTPFLGMKVQLGGLGEEKGQAHVAMLWWLAM